MMMSRCDIEKIRKHETMKFCFATKSVALVDGGEEKSNPFVMRRSIARSSNSIFLLRVLLTDKQAQHAAFHYCITLQVSNIRITIVAHWRCRRCRFDSRFTCMAHAFRILMQIESMRYLPIRLIVFDWSNDEKKERFSKVKRRLHRCPSHRINEQEFVSSLDQWLDLRDGELKQRPCPLLFRLEEKSVTSIATEAMFVRISVRLINDDDDDVACSFSACSRNLSTISSFESVREQLREGIFTIASEKNTSHVKMPFYLIHHASVNIKTLENILLFGLPCVIKFTNLYWCSDSHQYS